jgi:protein disulfide-isomerase A1
MIAVALLLCLIGQVTATSPELETLTALNFTRTINDPTNAKPWLVSFIDPNCPFSQNLLTLKFTNVLFGKVDCLSEAQLCTDSEIDMYPTVKWYLDGTSGTVDGELDQDGLSTFANKLSSPQIKSLSTHEYIFPEGTSDEVAFVLHTSTEVPKEFENVAKKFPHQSVSFVSLQLNEANDAWIKGFTQQRSPTVLLRVERDVARTKVFRGDFTEDNLSEFVRSNFNSIVPEMTIRNKDALTDGDKYLVIGIIDPQLERGRPFLQEFRNYVTNAAPSIREHYDFVWLNPEKWDFFLNKFEIDFSGEPTVLIVDLNLGMYWNPEQDNASASMDAMSQLLKNVIDGNVPPKYVSDENPGKDVDRNDFRNWLPFQRELKVLEDYPTFRFFFLLFVCLDVILIGSTYLSASNKLTLFAEKYLWYPVDKFIEFITEDETSEEGRSDDNKEKSD